MDREDILRRAPIFASLDPADLAALAGLAREAGLKAGEFVFWEGNESRDLYIIARGRVKVLKYASTGKEFIIAFFGPGEMLGEAAVFQGKPYPATAQATEDTQLLVLSREAFLHFLGGHPGVALAIISMLSARLRDAQSRLKDLAGERVEQRLARVLLMLAAKLGPALPFTRQELADMAGTTTETAIRVTGQLRERGIIRSVRGKLTVVNEEKLRLLAEGPPLDLVKADKGSAAG
ncbi:MAG: Crp/Fnr family transcriptional regulator [Chloroflexi bacterium]|nr:Crp/Fnr family transcriptional regulator [Chloroflexota bacterium]